VSDTRTPLGVRVIAVINLVAAVITVTFWALVYARLFAPGPPADPVLRASSAATLGFLIGDIIWAVPLLALSVAGLWRLRPWGWLVAQMVNILWAYSMTVIWVRDVYAGQVSPGAILFTPFALFAVWATARLWKVRDRFRAETRRSSEKDR